MGWGIYHARVLRLLSLRENFKSGEVRLGNTFLDKAGVDSIRVSFLFLLELFFKLGIIFFVLRLVSINALLQCLILNWFYYLFLSHPCPPGIIFIITTTTGFMTLIKYNGCHFLSHLIIRSHNLTFVHLIPPSSAFVSCEWPQKLLLSYFLYYKLIFLLVMTIWLLKLEPEHYYFEGGVD